jgi:uncharacterized membrane protein YdjX (TVP38/TMEM64 family)
MAVAVVAVIHHMLPWMQHQQPLHEVVVQYHPPPPYWPRLGEQPHRFRRLWVATTARKLAAAAVAAARTTFKDFKPTMSPSVGVVTGGLPSSPEEELAFFWELMHFAKHRNWKKKVLSVLICISSFIVLIDLIFFHHVRNIIEAFLQWMTMHHFLAVLTFLVFFILATLLFVPPIILFFGAGFAFCNVCGFWYGIVVATIVSCLGSTIGAVLAFVRSRYVMRELVQLFAKRYPIVKAADQAFARNGFHVMLLLRLCPIIPFNGLNYIGGVTNIELDQFIYALVGIVPTVIFWVFVGASADKLANNTADDVSEQILLVALLMTGVLFALAALVLLFRYAKEELRKEIAADRAHNWHTYQKPPTSYSTTTGATLSSSTEFAMESGGGAATTAGVIQHSDSDELREEGFEMLARYPTDVLAVLGFAESPLENDRIPEDLSDEEWCWVWT